MQPKLQLLKKQFKGKGGVHLIEGVPTGDGEQKAQAMLEKFFKQGYQSAVILEDVMSEVEKSKWASRLFTRGSHHLNLSVISLMQRVFASREQRLQSSFVVLMSFPADKTAVMSLARQLMPEVPWDSDANVQPGYRQKVSVGLALTSVRNVTATRF